MKIRQTQIYLLLMVLIIFIESTTIDEAIEFKLGETVIFKVIDKN